VSPLSAISAPLSAYGVLPAQVQPLRSPPPPAPIQLGRPEVAAPAAPAGDSFATVLGRFVQEVNAKQHLAADTVNALQAGQNVPLHQAVIALEEANVSFQLMVEVRNKLLESYQELMRMQI